MLYINDHTPSQVK